MDTKGRYYRMPAGERDQLIWQLRSRGWTMQRIAKKVGMTPSGVCRALDRMKAGRVGIDARDG